MRLQSLSLEHVRSYQRLSLVTSGERCAFVGPNGSGKTNLIEAISFLSWGRSCLRIPADDVLRWGEDFFRIRGEGSLDDGTPASFEYVWQRIPRRQGAMFVNDIRTPLLQFIGALKTVIFLPEALDLFTGPPAQRRMFLDALLSQTEGDFSALRLEYDRVMKQRNALLKRISDGSSRESELELWDDLLSEIAAKLQKRRLDLIRRLAMSLPAEISALSGKEWGGAEIVYERKTQKDDVEAIAAEFKALFLHYRSRDVLLQSTTVGPHRDDWTIMLKAHRVAQFASRGQQRSCLLALLFLSARIIQDVSHERPLILLDDVLSELDDVHQSALFRALKDHQVFITSAHPIPLTEHVDVWSVAGGKVKQVPKRAA